jgi:hypothetical protein
MSAVPLIADVTRTSLHVRFVPIADIREFPPPQLIKIKDPVHFNKRVEIDAKF